MFQPARPRGARPIVFDDWFCNYGVSTRAPARGATGAKNPATAKGFSFNPRAREGRDGGRTRATPSTISFNPRAREGRDRKGHL